MDPELASQHHNKGLLLAAESRYAESLDELLTAMRLDPDNLRFRSNLAEVFTILGRFDEARMHFEFMMAREPDGPVARDAGKQLN